MGSAVYAALVFGIRLVVTAPGNIVTVFDGNCRAVPSAAPGCERVAFHTGHLEAAMNAWCGVLLIVFAVWLLHELWSTVAPSPVTDDFLKLLDDSFGRSWRRPRSWPWARLGWAYGFTMLGAVAALSAGLLASAMITSARAARAPGAHVETSERVAPIP